MSYQLIIKGTDADLFPDYELSFELEVYDSDEVGAIKSPFSFDNKLPYTQVNRGIFLSYDYETEFGNLTNQSFDYVMYSNGQIVSKGSVSAQEVVVNAEEPYFNCSFEDYSVKFIRDLKALKIQELYTAAIDAAIGSTGFSETNRTLGTYLLSNTDYAGRDIELPYIDFDNSQNQFGYNKRQFTNWGLDERNVGLMPTLRVINFIKRVFYALGYTTSDYVSNFGYNGASAPSWNSQNLYMLYPSRLMSETVGTRINNLTPFSSNIFRNEDQIIGDNEWDIDAYNTTKGYYPYSPTNYNTSESTVENDYGLEFVSPLSPATASGDARLGFIAYSSSFPAHITWQAGNTSRVIDDMYLCVYSVSYDNGSNIFPYLVEDIVDANDAYFTPYIVIWESEIEKYRIPLKDSNGDVISIQGQVVQAQATIDEHQYTGGGGAGHTPNNTLYFEPFTAYLDEVREVFASNKYQISFELEMEGTLLCDISSNKHNYVYNGISVTDDMIKKARLHGYSYANLKTRFATSEPFLASMPSDQFNFNTSLELANTYTPYDVLSEIMKRFGLSLIYNYYDDKFYLDTIDDMRSGTPLEIDDYVDSLEPYSIYSKRRPYNKIKLSNKDFGGLYDKYDTGLAIGSYDGVFDDSGDGELSITFDSALINPINKTVCGPVFEPNFDLVLYKYISTQQAGFVNNEIRKYQEIGLRFLYLSSPDYKTTLRHPKYLGRNGYGIVVDSIVYEPVGTFLMQGISSDVGPSGTLRFADKDGTTLAFYDYYIGLEKIAANTRASMELRVAFPIQWLTNNYLYTSTFKFASTNEEFVVESFSASIYNDYAYGTMKIKFL